MLFMKSPWGIWTENSLLHKDDQLTQESSEKHPTDVDSVTDRGGV
jgi:hypothetical protein